MEEFIFTVTASPKNGNKSFKKKMQTDDEMRKFNKITLAMDKTGIYLDSESSEMQF
jgi:hypothetical protein